MPTGNGQPSGVCVDKRDNVWYTEYNSAELVLSPRNTLLGRLRDSHA